MKRHRHTVGPSKPREGPAAVRSGHPVSSFRHFTFVAVTAAVPVLFLVLLEVALRLAHYGGDLRLVVPRPGANPDMLMINRGVARRYFYQRGAVVPEPADDSFLRHKPGNTKRIFFLGESTMAGFPYEFHATAPSFVGDRLRALLPEYNIEIINVGMSAVGSFVVDDLVDEVLAQDPDLIVVYLGHNEFYGVYGAGSSMGPRTRPWMTRLMLPLLRIKIALLLRDAVERVREMVIPAPAIPGGTLMGQMVGQQDILYQGEVYRSTLTAFRENLTSIIVKAKDAGVPLMFSALVSNIRDLPPFRDAASDSAREGGKANFSAMLEAGDHLSMTGDWIAAAVAYQAILMIHPGSPTAWYRLGRAQLARGDSAAARVSLVRAKDLDGLRFRATEEFQDTLAAVCRRYGIPLARADSTFAAASPGGLPGHELILEHLHPTIEGYFLLAKSWTRAIYEADVLAPQSDWRWTDLPPDSVLMAGSTVSEFDRLVGDIKIALMTHRWPFTDSRKPFTYVPQSTVQGVAYEYVSRKLAWSDARYRLSEYYAAVGRYDDARRECRAVGRILSTSYQPLLRIADLYRMEGRNGEAYEEYLAAIRTEDNPYARLKAAIILLEREEGTRAAAQIETALGMSLGGGWSLPGPAAAGAHYLLGVAYAKLGRTADAIAQVRQCLAIAPDDREARQLLRQLIGR
ncbi:MAG: tetratricopeptide repeat protein [Bacteroidota bacterium]